MAAVRVPFRMVDVFADRPFAGNQLCVVPEPVDLPTGVMQTLAREIGFSETTFVTEVGGARYAMRIFTPATELPFAGHPSLGTAFVLVGEDRVSTPVTQAVAAGEFELWVDLARNFVRMRQGPAELGPAFAQRGDLAAAVGLTLDDLAPGLPIQLVSTGFGHLIVPMRDAATVARADPDPRRLSRLLLGAGTDGCYLFAITDDRADGAQAKARLFAPPAGIIEDPATGSAAGPLGAYVVRHGLTSSPFLTISQGEEIGRPSTLHVEVERDEEGEEPADWRVFVAGSVWKAGEGWFELPT
jgi:trans-2,3-dihydro-3-hydroxyanthranilate isomerase